LSKDHAFRNDGHEEVFLKTSDGEEISALFYSGKREDVILYFHGNAGDLSSWQFVSDDFTSLDYSFFILDFRGYGKSSGVISEEGFYNDAEAAYQYLITVKKIKPENILIYGRSIGSGVAVELAARHKTKALMLEAPYSSLRTLAREKAPYVFPQFWLKYHFNSIAKINRVQCPILFIHGSKDTLIPAQHSRKLTEAFSGQKQLLIIDGGSHNDLRMFESYHNGLKKFLENLI
jgi:uncharacterized protein